MNRTFLHEIETYPLSRVEITHKISHGLAITTQKEKLVLVKNKAHPTYEFPGGHREPNEAPESFLIRELEEELGLPPTLFKPLCLYRITTRSIDHTNEDRFALLAHADYAPQVQFSFNYEIKEAIISNDLPQSLSYPSIMKYHLELFRDFQSGLSIESRLKTFDNETIYKGF